MKKYYYKIKNTYIKFWKNANNKFYDLELYDDKFNRFYNGKIKFSPLTVPLANKTNKMCINKILREILAYLNISKDEFKNIIEIKNKDTIDKLENYEVRIE